MDRFRGPMGPVRKCLRDGGIGEWNVRKTALVGGSTRIPRAQAMVQELLNGEAPCGATNPDEAVTFGAAVWVATLAGGGSLC